MSALSASARLAAPPPQGLLARQALDAREALDVGLLLDDECVRRRFARDTEIFAEEDPADRLYEVVEGVVRTTRLLGDGRRQIEDFHFAGDLFGFEPGLTHRTTAEAVGEVVVKVIRRSALTELAERDARTAGRLWAATMRDLGRSRDHVMMLGRRSAAERLAGFLVELAERTGAGEALELPMSRQDMADYLGLTIETVSRTFTQFQNTGLMRAQSYRRVAVDLDGLRELCV